MNEIRIAVDNDKVQTVKIKPSKSNFEQLIELGREGVVYMFFFGLGYFTGVLLCG